MQPMHSFPSGKTSWGVKAATYEQCFPLHNFNLQTLTCAGIHSTAWMASRAAVLKPSTEANHCSVALKMVGFLLRQS